MQPDSRFYDRIAERYAKKPIADEAAYQQKLRITRQYLRPDMAVLEFGCGTGSTAIAQAPFVKHILAIDFSAAMIDIARRKAAATDVKNVTFEQADIDDFEAPDQSFDAVMGHSVLHLLDDRDATIAKVYRLLKPGGVFVSSTTCVGDTLKIFKLIGPIGRRLGLLPLLRVFTTKDLTDSLTAAGFDIGHQWQPARGKAVFIVARKTG